MSQVGGMAYEQAQTYRKAIFSLVHDKVDWKRPIDARLTVAGEDEAKELIEALSDAVVFFTGSVPQFRHDAAKGELRVIAAGYRLTCGA